MTNKQAQKRRCRQRLPKLIRHPLGGSVSLVGEKKRTKTGNFGNISLKLWRKMWQHCKSNIWIAAPVLNPVEALCIMCVVSGAERAGGWTWAEEEEDKKWCVCWWSHYVQHGRLSLPANADVRLLFYFFASLRYAEACVTRFFFFFFFGFK